MGTPISTLIEEENRKDVVFKEFLQMLEKNLINKIAATSESMKTAAIEDGDLPVVAIVDKTEKYLVKCSLKGNKDVTDAIDNMLSGDFLSGIKDTITLAVKVLLGDKSGFTTQQNGFHVVFANNSLLRLDYLLYKYNFQSEGFQNKCSNAFCYYMQIGVLNLEKVNAQVLLYELTKSIGMKNIATAKKELSEISEFAKFLFKTVDNMENKFSSNYLMAVTAKKSKLQPYVKIDHSITPKDEKKENSDNDEDEEEKEDEGLHLPNYSY